MKTYDPSALKTAEDCRTVMRRARERKLDDFYNSVFRRLCELSGDFHEDPDDPLTRHFYETLAAYEQLLTEKNGSNTRASRTRQKLARKGVHQSLIEWTRGKVETNGFLLLLEKGFPEYTGEFLVMRYRARFPDDVVHLAQERLEKHGIEIPE